MIDRSCRSKIQRKNVFAVTLLFISLSFCLLFGCTKTSEATDSATLFGMDQERFEGYTPYEYSKGSINLEIQSPGPAVGWSMILNSEGDPIFIPDARDAEVGLSSILYEDMASSETVSEVDMETFGMILAQQYSAAPGYNLTLLDPTEDDVLLRHNWISENGEVKEVASFIIKNNNDFVLLEYITSPSIYNKYLDVVANIRDSIIFH